MSKIICNSFEFKPIGTITAASHNDKLVFIVINENNLKNLALKTNLTVYKDTKSNLNTINQLKEYFFGERRYFDIETEFLIGTEFQKSVWQKLTEIPYGTTVSYLELAQNIGNPNAARAIGNANGKNPVPIVIPCHRVIRNNGNIGGFSCGVQAKQFLLNLESR